jgi:chromosome condensin MukBEF MukE localization factor
MSKSNYFSSKSVFGQLISLIDNKKIKDAVQKTNPDRYVKRFKSKDHVISMLFCSFAKCNSLQEVYGAIIRLSGKTESVHYNHIPKRSTLSDASKNRKVEFFEDKYNKLQFEYGSVL